MPTPAAAPATAATTLILVLQEVITHVGADDALLAKLSSAEDALKAEVAADEASDKALSDKIDALTLTVSGDGTDANPGLAGRITKLEGTSAVDLGPLTDRVTTLEHDSTGLLDDILGDSTASPPVVGLLDRVTALEKVQPGTDPALTARVDALEARNAADDAAAGGLAGGGLGGGDTSTGLTITGLLGDLQVGVAVDVTFASTGVGPVHFNMLDGALPDGLTLADGGNVTGTPTTAGPYEGDIASSDANGKKGILHVQGTVAPAAITELTLTGSLDGLTVGQSFTTSIGSDGKAPVAYSVTSGSVDGLTFDAGGGVSGTPTTEGPFSVTVEGTDADGIKGDLVLTGTVAAAAVDTNVGGNGVDSLTGGTAAVAGDQPQSITGGQGTDQVTG